MELGVGLHFVSGFLVRISGIQLVLTAVHLASCHAHAATCHIVELHSSGTNEILSIAIHAEGVLAAIFGVRHVGDLSDRARLRVANIRIESTDRSADLAFAKFVRAPWGGLLDRVHDGG